MAIVPIGASSSALELFADAANANRKDSRAISDAQQQRVINAMRQEIVLKNLASETKQFNSMVQAGQQAGKAVQKGVQAGQEAAAAGDQLAIEGNLETALQTTGGDAAQAEALAQVEVGDGQTLGDVFSEDQLAVLSQDSFTEEELTAAGFDEDTREELMDLQEDGFTEDEAVDFMYKRTPAGQAQARMQKIHGHISEFSDALGKVPVTQLGNTASEQAKATKNAQREREGGKRARASEREGRGADLALLGELYAEALSKPDTSTEG